MDPVIIVGAGPVGLTLALALARQEVPSVVLDEGPGKDEQRLARTVVLREDTAALVERLTGLPLADAGFRWAGWRSMRRKQVMREIAFDAGGSGTDPLDFESDLQGLGGAAHGSGSGAQAFGGAFGGGAHGAAGGAQRSEGSARHPKGSAQSQKGAGSGPTADAQDSEGAHAPAPLHLAQHALTGALREAISHERLIKVAVNSRLDSIEQESSGVTVHTRGPNGTWWRGSYVVGCDGPRSTVRKLQDIRFPGRTAVERHAVAALRAELPWPGQALLHRMPPWRTSGPSGGEVTARPLADDVWRLDWLLPPGKDLVTPDLLVARIRETLAGWNDGSTPPYELLDTGVHTVHHRLARRWRVGRVFLAGDAAHLLGALGTQGLDEGLRDADNLAWKLALAWHHGPHEALLDSYQAERRAVVAARLRAADQALPLLRSGGGLRSYVPGSARGHDTLLTDGHLGRGPLGAPGAYADSPLAPAHTESETPVDTAPGAPVVDVRVTAEDGSFVRLRDRLGRGALLVVLIAPGTGVWARKHWVTAGIMPRLAAAVTALPHRAELLVAESYPGAAAHTVLLVRPDGHLVTALSGVRPADLYAAAEATLGGPALAEAETAASST
ncbi:MULTISPECIES: FAD-dependent monooxygenase [unclassified Streptomyces]|uniref:FAD-dependent monooxygenase n=1 Tax=unclassified Streptomyces TaxID=2593676 RepID=UPI00224E2932|nr:MULTISPECIES: FAD-dependent monooxygenase [unclassified Streptomyces]MCX4407512.1 FAD-dependent monooxygenase [Streptomyces sp. NBC_01764]MCX5187773.1 FAD-dependent monooxygenase [Streptomyces sp. NBC_00268]